MVRIARILIFNLESYDWSTIGELGTEEKQQRPGKHVSLTYDNQRSLGSIVAIRYVIKK